MPFEPCEGETPQSTETQHQTPQVETSLIPYAFSESEPAQEANSHSGESLSQESESENSGQIY